MKKVNKKVKKFVIGALAGAVAFGGTIGTMTFSNISVKEAFADVIDITEILDRESGKTTPKEEETTHIWEEDYTNILGNQKEVEKVCISLGRSWASSWGHKDVTCKTTPVYDGDDLLVGCYVEVSDEVWYGEAVFDLRNKGSKFEYHNYITMNMKVKPETAEKTLYEQLSEGLSRPEEKIYITGLSYKPFLVFEQLRSKANVSGLIIDGSSALDLLQKENLGLGDKEGDFVSNIDNPNIGVSRSIALTEDFKYAIKVKRATCSLSKDLCTFKQIIPLVNKEDKVVGYQGSVTETVTYDNNRQQPYGCIISDYTVGPGALGTQIFDRRNGESRYDYLERLLGEKANGGLYVMGDHYEYAVLSASGTKACIDGVVVDRAKFDELRKNAVEGSTTAEIEERNGKPLPTFIPIN